MRPGAASGASSSSTEYTLPSSSLSSSSDSVVDSRSSSPAQETSLDVFDELHDDARPDSILTALEGLLVEAERRLRQIEAGVRCTNTEGCACHGCQLAELRAENAAAEARSR